MRPPSSLNKAFPFGTCSRGVVSVLTKYSYSRLQFIFYKLHHNLPNLAFWHLIGAYFARHLKSNVEEYYWCSACCHQNIGIIKLNLCILLDPCKLVSSVCKAILCWQSRSDHKSNEFQNSILQKGGSQSRSWALESILFHNFEQQELDCKQKRPYLCQGWLHLLKVGFLVEINRDSPGHQPCQHKGKEEQDKADKDFDTIVVAFVQLIACFVVWRLTGVEASYEDTKQHAWPQKPW